MIAVIVPHKISNIKKGNDMVIFKAKIVMISNVVYIQKQTPIDEAIEILADKNITGLPVVNGDMTLAGVISEKEVMQLLYDNGTMSDIVEDFMTENPLSFEQEDNLIDIAECFMKNNFRRVPITSEGKLVGIVSRRNIIEYILQLRRKDPVTV